MLLVASWPVVLGGQKLPIPEGVTGSRRKSPPNKRAWPNRAESNVQSANRTCTAWFVASEGFRLKAFGEHVVHPNWIKHTSHIYIYICILWILWHDHSLPSRFCQVPHCPVPCNSAISGFICLGPSSVLPCPVIRLA